MHTRIYRTAIVLLIVILLGGCTWKQQKESADPVSPKPVLPGEYFITHHLMTDQGLIRTSFAEQHIYLSESLGLWMDYLVRKKDQNLFDQQLGVLQDQFLLDHHLLSWQIESEQKSKTNALVDDLRVVAALQKANRLWKKSAYQTTAKEIAQALKEKNMFKAILSDYYDASTNRTSHTITLSYIDPKAIKELESLQIFTKQMTSNQLALLKQAPRKKGFFPKSYDIKKKTYSFDREINMIDQLYTALHAHHAKVNTSAIMKWLKTTFKQEGKLYGRYKLSTLQPSVTYESPSVYALVLLYALKQNELEFAKAVYHRMKELQTQDPLKPYYGGYMNEKDTHSFDNLLPLIAERELLNESVVQ
ncbi:MULTISPECIES: glycosyl hydrolase family 8 [unclassified Bacillus (in: firmicutes)]|uniref:glycosyl hydrolase family 8 n=1 Tax=unclassified Bacillus (in: firmicutes) TaxID=185979 RepID=UPI000D030ADB|nr:MULTISPECIES: glycosyl hydrolase family 8 [unclassified Bacillus (in: firmicutes)]PRS80084.1 glycosyl hydrolase lipoprotein [Bacillus sp. CJCL2]PRS85064.1 glycosyl hydrolase lipoprotein [Bacillus sp. YBWC18]